MPLSLSNTILKPETANSPLRRELMEIMETLQQMSPSSDDVWGTIIGSTLLALFCALVWLIVRKVLIRLAQMAISKSKTTWDDQMVEAGVFDVGSHIPSLVIFAVGVLVVPSIPAGISDTLSKLTFGILAIQIARLVSAVLNGVNGIYNQSARAMSRPIKGYIQVAQVIAYIAGIVSMVSIWLGKSPVIFLSGLGAMSAVLLLVFRDTLLSLVAGIQLTSNGLIRVGDWIEMQSFGADGTVTDIALNTVTVQNFDRTLTLIPTHKFLEHSFRNWRHVFDSKARRIKRHILIDATSIHFLKPEEIDHLCGIALLRPYLEKRRLEVEAFNKLLEERGEAASVVNRRALTNIGTFRAYAQAYLEAHSELRKDLITMVRQLQPTDNGIPLEIYAFVANPTWVHYETVQSDIFDHFFSIIPEFGLRQYQAPSGTDIRTAGRSLGDAVHAIEASRQEQALQEIEDGTAALLAAAEKRAGGNPEE